MGLPELYLPTAAPDAITAFTVAHLKSQWVSDSALTCTLHLLQELAIFWDVSKWKWEEDLLIGKRKVQCQPLSHCCPNRKDLWLWLSWSSSCCGVTSILLIWEWMSARNRKCCGRGERSQRGRDWHKCQAPSLECNPLPYAQPSCLQIKHVSVAPLSNWMCCSCVSSGWGLSFMVFSCHRNSWSGITQVSILPGNVPCFYSPLFCQPRLGFRSLGCHWQE